MPAKCTFCETTALDRARDLFWRQGYAATSIPDLEAALGIKRSSIYNTFRSKRALYERSLLAYRDQQQGALRRQLAEAPALRPALAELFRAAAAEPAPGQPRGCYLVSATTELAAVDPTIAALVADNRARFVALLEEALAGARERGELQPLADAELRTVAETLFVGFSGLRVAQASGMGAEALRAVGLGLVEGVPWGAGA